MEKRSIHENTNKQENRPTNADQPKATAKDSKKEMSATSSTKKEESTKITLPPPPPLDPTPANKTSTSTPLEGSTSVVPPSIQSVNERAAKRLKEIANRKPSGKIGQSINDIYANKDNKPASVNDKFEEAKTEKAKAAAIVSPPDATNKPATEPKATNLNSTTTTPAAPKATAKTSTPATTTAPTGTSELKTFAKPKAVDNTKKQTTTPIKAGTTPATAKNEKPTIKATTAISTPSTSSKNVISSQKDVEKAIEEGKPRRKNAHLLNPAIRAAQFLYRPYHYFY